MPSNVRDQRRRAVGAPLAEQSLWMALAVPASGVTTSAERCIALLGRRDREFDAQALQDLEHRVVTRFCTWREGFVETFATKT